MPADPPTVFQRWIAEAARDVGAEVPALTDPLGLTFEAEGHVARVLPHADEALAVIEVMAVSVDGVSEEDAGRLAVQLLKLNHEACFEHGWSIALDGDRLTVTTTVAVPATGGHALSEILYDGIDRAAALSRVVSGLIDLGAPPPETGATVGVNAIRG